MAILGKVSRTKFVLLLFLLPLKSHFLIEFFFCIAIGTIYLYLGPYNFGDVSLNSATLPPLTTIVLELITIPVVIMFCREIETVKLMSEDKIPIWKDKEAKQVLVDVLKLFVVYIVSMMSLWVVFAQIMPIGVLMFQISSDDLSNIWIIYLPPVIGALLGMIVTRRVIGQLSVSDDLVLVVASIGVTVSLVAFIQFKTVEHAAIFFVGGTSLFFFFGIQATAFRTIYSQTVGDSRHLNVMMSLLFVGGALGQIIGPIFSSLFISVECDSASSSSSGFDFSGCEMSGLNIGIIISIVLMALATLYTAALLFYFKLPSLEKGRMNYELINESVN